MTNQHVAQAFNPYTKQWVTFPQPVLVGTNHLTCFKAETIRRFAQLWNAGHPNELVDLPDGAKGCPTCAPHFNYATPAAQDLHAAIRERLDERPILISDEAVRAASVNQWVTAARDALLAVLDWHALGYRYGEEPGKPPNWCHACNDVGPCYTVQAIAEKLGVGT